MIMYWLHLHQWSMGYNKFEICLNPWVCNLRLGFINVQLPWQSNNFQECGWRVRISLSSIEPYLSMLEQKATKVNKRVLTLSFNFSKKSLPKELSILKKSSTPLNSIRTLVSRVIFKFQKLSNDIKNSSIQWVLGFVITFWKFENPLRFQLSKWEFTLECEGSFPHTLLHFWKYEMWFLGFLFWPTTL